MTDREPTASGPESRALSDCVQGFIGELATLDRRAMERVHMEPDLASGQRPLYRVADVRVTVSGVAELGSDSLVVRAGTFDFTMEFSIEATHGGELLE